jgi:2-keto-3-deoxy-L-rhamnonate aldolase RhmA
MPNNLKARLKRNEKIIGTMIITVENIQIARLVKVLGFDFFVLDCEHGSFDYTSAAGILAMAREVGIPAIVRIPEVSRPVVLKFMEMGAAGLLLPNTDSAEQARRLVEYSKYAPMGNRGVSLLRAHSGFEKVESPADYMKKANEETVLMVQIETRSGLEHCEEILAVDGIDAAFVGPGDLSQCLGMFGQQGHPDFIAAVERVIRAARQNGKYSGIHGMTTPEALQSWIAKGMTLNLWVNEVLLMMSAAKEGLAKLRGSH